MHITTLGVVNNLANLYNRLGNYEESRVLYDRALLGKVEVLGAAHSSTKNTITNLATMLVRAGRPSERDELLRKYKVSE